MHDADGLRGSTVIETIGNITHAYFGDEVELPEDVISALLVLAHEIGAAISVDEDNARLVTNDEIGNLVGLEG